MLIFFVKGKSFTSLSQEINASEEHVENTHKTRANNQQPRNPEATTVNRQP